ncbi:monovalent cation/H+ antiporter complex subunit F [Glycomyces xiaoerkulensis]|uniref:monovalent cation/H+ antiporter complex subunit F n=1 Tax=Glycomyces xiaoerkulensis TaxID=2038139 RepID=UPI000C259FD9|nr:monovalent cation/H+ antiporter complex subunit F [Glycomyces xiaoerkulensis]
MEPLDIALAVAAAAFAFTAVRIVRGPADADRVVAGDLAYFAFVATAAVIGVRLPGTSFLTLVLVATLIGFLSSLSWARLLDREEER